MKEIVCMMTSSNGNSFPRYWPLVRGIYRSPVNSPHKGLWRRALMFSLICSWINDWVNNREAGDLRCHHVHYDVIVMCLPLSSLDYGVINPRMAVTKAPQISPLFIFLGIQTHMLDYQKSRLYFTGVAEAEHRRILSTMNVVFDT